VDTLFQSDNHGDNPGISVSEVETEIVLLFINLAHALGLPKSHGEIFGILFCSPEPICFDDVITRTGISKGSASQGLRLLQRINAVRQVHVARDRRSFFEPELRMRHLLGGFLRETVEPHIQNGANHINHIEKLAGQNGDDLHPVLHERILSLRSWNQKASGLLPWILKLASPSNRPGPPG
jgi:DNA-binding transcriptional regulator GbsR (MarR family)